MTKKRCTKCDTEKNLSEFRKDSRRSDGRQSWCKLCMRLHQTSVYSKKYGAKARSRNGIRIAESRAKIQAYKTEHGCSKCSERAYQCLDFHHLDPTQKDFGLSSIGTQSWERIMEEINKCILVCKNCHCKIHAGLI